MAFFQASAGLDVLPAVLVDLGEGVAGLLAVVALAPAGDALVDLDPVELVGQLEALDAGGEPGDGLVVVQGVQGEGAGPCRPSASSLPAEAVAGHRLHAELAAQEVGEGHVDFVERGRGRTRRPGRASSASARRRCWRPRSSWGGGGRPGCPRHRPGRRGRRRRGTVVAVLVVGQLAQVGEVLQPPGLVVARAVEEHVGEVAGGTAATAALSASLAVRGRACCISCRARTRSRCMRADEAAAAALVAAVELAGDDEAVVLDRWRSCWAAVCEQPPVVLVGGDDGLAEVVDLVDAAEVAAGSGRRGRGRRRPWRGRPWGRGRACAGRRRRPCSCRLAWSSSAPRVFAGAYRRRPARGRRAATPGQHRPAASSTYRAYVDSLQRTTEHSATTVEKDAQPRSVRKPYQI